MIRKIVNFFRGNEKKRNIYYLVSYPKSGNTWLRFMIGSYLTDKKVSFSNYHSIIPDIHRNPEDIKKVNTNPIFIKSHFSFQENYNNVIYIVRDGRDVAVSYYYQLKGKGRIPNNMSFKEFLFNYFFNGSEYFGDWGDHVNSWLFDNPTSKNQILVRYEDLLEDTNKELSRIIKFTKLPFSKEKLSYAIESASLSNMKADENQNRGVSIEHIDASDPEFKFVRKGVQGDWKIYFDDESILAFKNRYGNLMGRLGYI